MESVEAALDWVVKISGGVLLGSVVAAVAGGVWRGVAEGIAVAGLVGLVSVPTLRLVVLVVRLWREGERVHAGFAALLLVLLVVVAARHV